ncbi:transposase, partial [Thermococcus sp. PK]
MKPESPRIKRTRHAKHFITYHFVWIPKYRRDILTGKVVERL